MDQPKIKNVYDRNLKLILVLCTVCVVSAICAIMDEINTEHNMKSICRQAVAQWTERLTRKGQTRVRNWKGANILLSRLHC